MGAAAAVIAAQRARQERELIDHLRDREAFSPATATALRPQRSMGQAILRKLVSEKAVLQTGDLYWLDEAAYAAMRAARERNAAWAIGIVIGIVMMLALGAALVAVMVGRG
jgi:hypothetical protein